MLNTVFFHSTFGASVLKIVYGIDAKEEDDEYLKANHAALDAISQGLVPGKYMVQFFPCLRHIPTWFPGAYSQRQWAEWQAASAKAQDMPFAFVQENQVNAHPSQPMLDKAQDGTRTRQQCIVQW